MYGSFLTPLRKEMCARGYSAGGRQTVTGLTVGLWELRNGVKS